MYCNSIVKQLEAFAKLSHNSFFILNNGVDLLYQAFAESKPLFPSAKEKSKAYQLLSTSLKTLDLSLEKFSGSLNVDKRQTAQKVRSGLQFLVDELLELETTTTELRITLKNIANWDSVKSIEEFISNTTGVEPEHFTPEPQDLSIIPPSHVWWFFKDDD